MRSKKVKNELSPRYEILFLFHSTNVDTYPYQMVLNNLKPLKSYAQGLKIIHFLPFLKPTCPHRSKGICYSPLVSF